MSYGRSVLWGMLLGLVLALAFAGGFFVRELSSMSVSASALEDSGYPLLDEVQELLDQVYLRQQPDYTQRQYAAIRGMLSSLGDKNTFFIDPPVARSEAQALAGTYGGIGVQIKRNAQGLFELYPFADSPAARAGLKDGDLLRAVNGESITPAFQMDVVDQLLRGEVKDGNGVTVSVARGSEALEVFIEFAVINIPSVIWRAVDQGRFAYIQIVRFTNRTPSELEAAINDLQPSINNGVILDLRNNSGGLLDESIKVASQFIPPGVVIYEKNRHGERSFETVGGGLVLDKPLVVLVNNRTASASELVAGAIRDRGRGILIGQQTFGKGSVQQIFSLSDGSSVHITSAEWFTPNRTPIDSVGLSPDIVMIPNPDGVDVELEEAIRFLQRN
ncbi:MAG: S41 family peptidase [Anaerolineae bacterium]|nr:S41 family peptidase [Anaerolineae bacterium]